MSMAALAIEVPGDLAETVRIEAAREGRDPGELVVGLLRRILMPGRAAAEAREAAIIAQNRDLLREQAEALIEDQADL